MNASHCEVLSDDDGAGWAPPRGARDGDDLRGPSKDVAVPLAGSAARVSGGDVQPQLRCPACRARGFLNARLLRIHEDEEHNPLRARDARFACLVEGCERDFGSAHKRALHLEAKHGYPHGFRLGVVPTPRRQPHVACRFEKRQRGSCRYGAQCAFSHCEELLASAVPAVVSFGRPRRHIKTSVPEPMDLSN